MDYPAEVKEPIDWMLLTTLETESFEAACQRLSWYSRRWGIEVYHRMMKSGCRIEDRCLEDAHNLEACLAIDLVVAWRVHWLPNTSCGQILNEAEWRVLSAWATGTTVEMVPSAQEAMRWSGKMGGWLVTGKQDHAATMCIWRGLIRLQSMTQGYLLALRVHGIKAGP